MYNTEFGKYDGKGWEEFCQACFKIKYKNDGYQEIPATTHGDFGIEGYTKNGKVFQCYCPDFEVTSKKLYENQRDKINKDLNKLDKNKDELIKLFVGGNKIKEWIFVTPEYRNKELLTYCKGKIKEIQDLKLPFIDADFDIMVQNSGFMLEEARIVLEHNKRQLEIAEKKQPANSDITKWKDAQIVYTNNAVRKYEFLIPNSSKKDDKVQKITDHTVKDYLLGNSVLSEWKNKYPAWYEKFINIVGYYEEEVKKKCLLNVKNNNDLFEEIKFELQKTIQKEFSGLGKLTLQKITNQAISSWILLCSIDFE